jgi:uncharacterized membrane protein
MAMANGDDPQQPGGSAERNQRPPELIALEERVGRLEMELAVLRRQIAGEAAEVPAAAQIAQPAPPPPPVVQAGAEPGGAQRLVSEAWASRSFRQTAAQTEESRDSLESRLGSQIFNRIAIVLLLIGTAYSLKLAVDRGWIGPAGRMIVGLLAGAALVVWSERFRSKGFAAFSYSLKALGSGVLYLSLWAGFQLYHLLPTTAALGLMILVTAWNAYMAWAQDSELLAAYALAGGFATPMLLSTGGNHETFLFTYLLAIDVAIVALVRLRAWPRLLLGAFPLTVAFFIGWYVEFYAASELMQTSIFIALFGLGFASVPVGRAAVAEEPAAKRFLPLSTLLEDILLPLANAAFVALAFYSVLQDSGHHAMLPWLMLVLAAAYLALMRLPQTAVASAIHLSLAVVFLTIAIPLKASGHWITVSWLAEGLALLWAATRLQPAAGQEEASGAYASRTLRWLALGSLLLGFCGVCVHLVDLVGVAGLPLLNKGTGTALTGIAIFGAAAWLALRASGEPQAGVADEPKGGTADERGLVWGGIARNAFVLIGVTALLLTMRELGSSWSWGIAHAPFQTADFFTALMALAIFAGVIAVSLRLAVARAGEDFWMNCAGLSTIAFNLLAVLTGVREINAIWSSTSSWSADAALQQALAISGFLMLYGAVLLAAGFWRRSGFLRWQALLLLLFTIFKTFLYDMRNLSQGYRVVSLLGLGALLMAISFAYQKDWLNLRGAEAKRGAEPDRRAGADAGTGSGADPNSGAAR